MTIAGLDKLLQQAGVPYVVIDKNGDVRWVGEYGRPVWDEAQSRVTRLYIAGRDITDRKQAEVALQESEKRHRSIINAALDAVVTIEFIRNKVTSDFQATLAYLDTKIV